MGKLGTIDENTLANGVQPESDKHHGDYQKSSKFMEKEAQMQEGMMLGNIRVETNCGC
jgi:hypothetical protein